MKRCKVCGEVKPLSEFYSARGMRDGRRSDCRNCNLAAKARRNAANPEPARERARNWKRENPERYLENQRKRRQRPEVKLRERAGHLKRKYGITLQDYERMLDEQGGCCAICRRPPREGATLHVDHEHDTERVRGLLCFTCNNALGDFEDDPAALRAALSYLARGDEPEVTERARRRARALISA